MNQLPSSALSIMLAIMLGLSAHAQSNNQRGGSGNLKLRNNSGTINNTVNQNTITIILEERAYSSKSDAERRVLQNLAEVLSKLQGSGQLKITRQGVRDLADNAVAMLSHEPLKRNIISQREFSLTKGRTHSIAGTRVRVTYHGIECGQNGIRITLNGEKGKCLYPGKHRIFEYGGKFYELVYAGQDFSLGAAQFTIYSTPEEDAELHRGVPNATYGTVYRVPGNYDCYTDALYGSDGALYCSTRPSKR